MHKRDSLQPSTAGIEVARIVLLRLSVCFKIVSESIRQNKKSNSFILAATPFIRALISDSLTISTASSQVASNITFFNRILSKDAARTVQHVGHKVRIPGTWGDSSSLSLWNTASLHGEYFNNLQIS